MGLTLALSGCLGGVLVNSGAHLYCNTTTNVGKQLVRNQLTGGAQLLYCPEKEDVQVYTK